MSIQAQSFLTGKCDLTIHKISESCSKQSHHSKIAQSTNLPLTENVKNEWPV